MILSIHRNHKALQAHKQARYQEQTSPDSQASQPHTCCLNSCPRILYSKHPQQAPNENETCSQRNSQANATNAPKQKGSAAPQARTLEDPSLHVHCVQQRLRAQHRPRVARRVMSRAERTLLPIQEPRIPCRTRTHAGMPACVCARAFECVRAASAIASGWAHVCVRLRVCVPVCACAWV